MSNAEEKSSKASTDMLPLLRERNRSLFPFIISRILFFENGLHKHYLPISCVQTLL